MKFFSLFQIDLRILLRSFPLILTFPLFFILASFFMLPVGLTDKGTLPKVSLTMVNHDDAELTEILVNLVEELDMIDGFTETDLESAQKLLANGETDVVIEFPPKMLQNLIRGNEITVNVFAKDQTIGAIAKTVTERLADTMNHVQASSTAYYHLSKELFSTDKEREEAATAFDMSIVNESISRKHNIRVVRAASQYEIQLTALIVFLAAAIAAVFTAMRTAKEFSGGLIRRFRMHKIPFVLFWSEKMLLTVCVAIPLCLILAGIAAFFGFHIHLLRLAASSGFISLLLFSVFLPFSVSGKDNNRPIRSMFGAGAICILLLFLGGGFYPTYLMEFSIRDINPAWLSHLLAEWTLSDAQVGQIGIAPLSLFAPVLPAALCAGYAFFKQRSA
ncbi:MAG: ABC transporter permease [Clostridiales Family XIII bacterium]|nr:ABC transporter permease [Clostridiales Family XIII bacterium]